MNDYFLIIACVLRLPIIRKKKINFILKLKRILIGKLRKSAAGSGVSKTTWGGQDGCGLPPSRHRGRDALLCRGQNPRWTPGQMRKTEAEARHLLGGYFGSWQVLLR